MGSIRNTIHTGWRVVTEAHTVHWILDGAATLLPSGLVTALVAFLGEHSIVLLAIVFVAVLALLVLVLLAFLGYRADRQPRHLTSASTATDWSLRKLFAYLAPHLPLTASKTDGHTTIGTKDKRWEAIGDEVLKNLSLGRLHASGVGYRNITERMRPAPISPEFWRTAYFTYWFLDDDGKGILDAKNAERIEYSNIEVDRNEALTIWPHPFSPSLDRIPITELLLMGTPLGWDFVSNESLHLLDLQDAIRQGGLDGVLKMWGKLQKWTDEQLMRQEVLDRIPKEHWSEFRVHLFAAREGDNFNAKSWSVKPNSQGYFDLHVERVDVSPWLIRDAATFRGKTKSR